MSGVTGTTADAATDAASSPPDLCAPCASDTDCAGGVCAQFQGDSFCAPTCTGTAACTAGRTCQVASSAGGDLVSVCEPPEGVCGHSVGPGADAGTPDTSAPATTCGTLVAPSVPAQCHSCSSGSSGCQANGCYGGWWCDTATNHCQSPPSNCGPAGDAGVPSSTCPPPPANGLGGTVSTSGGTLATLRFAVVGDTRPATVDDTAGYPTAIISPIYQSIAAAQVGFVVSTGDYIFASTHGGQAGPQLDQYLQARNAFPGVVFPTMGNHECTGYTDSNCGAGTIDGLTANYTTYVTKLLTPIGQQAPYYSFVVNATDSSWTAKFVVIAANAWTTAQETWLGQVLAQPTTYTFVFRHEPDYSSTAPGVPPSGTILGQHSYTLLIVGHTHTYGHSGRQVIIGNGGAPLSGSGNYGWGLFERRADGAIQVDMVDYASGLCVPSFRFAVHADGTPVP